MTDTPDISEAEWEVMQVLWDAPGLTANEVVDRVAGRRGWNPRTVKTLLNRLLTKRAIAADKDGRRFLYRPLIERADYVHAESKGLLDRLFDGRVAPLVAHFSEKGKLSRKDIAELKRLIGELEDGQ